MTDERQRLIAQRAALAEFGRLALNEVSLDAILREACRLVVEGLGLKHAKVVQAIPAQNKLYIRAEIGFGLSEEERWMEPGRGSSAGYALMTGEPNFSPEADRDPRFQCAVCVSRAGVKSLANTLIPGTGPEGSGWWGVLEADSTERNAFTRDQLDFLKQYANLIASAVQRQESSAQLEALVEDKERLLQELQHRVKNNFATVMSVLRLESRSARTEEAKASLGRVEQRVGTLSLVHEHLYRRYDTQTIPIGPYLDELLDHLSTFHDLPGRNISTSCEVADLTLGAEAAIAIGQIVSEFVSNSVSYAFDDPGGALSLDLTLDGDTCRLALADNGRGLPTGGEARSGTGMAIIAGLAQRLGGEAEWSSKDGARLEIAFPAFAGPR